MSLSSTIMAVANAAVAKAMAHGIVTDDIESVFKKATLHQSGSFSVSGQLDSIPLPGIHVNGMEADIAFPLSSDVAKVSTFSHPSYLLRRHMNIFDICCSATSINM